MNINKRGLVLAMESHTPVCTDYQPTYGSFGYGNDVDVVETAAEPIELEPDELEAGVSKAIDYARRIEEMAQVTKEAAAEGGMGPTGAQALSASVGKMTGELGMDISALMPSLEAFKNPQTRVKATEIATEALADTVKRIYKAVAAAILQMFKKIGKLGQELFTTAKTLRGRWRDAMALQQQGFHKPVSVIKNNKIVKSLAVGNSLPADIGRAIGAYRTQINEINEYIRVQSDWMIKTFIPALERYRSKADKSKLPTDYPVPTFLKKAELIDAGSIAKLLHNPANLDIYRSDVLPGNFRIIGIIPKQDLEESTRPAMIAGNEDHLGFTFVSMLGYNPGPSTMTLEQDKAVELLNEVDSLLSYLEVDVKNMTRQTRYVMDAVETQATRLLEEVADDNFTLVIKDVELKFGDRTGQENYQVASSFLYNFSTMLWSPYSLHSKMLDSLAGAIDLVRESYSAKQIS